MPDTDDLYTAADVKEIALRVGRKVLRKGLARRAAEVAELRGALAVAAAGGLSADVVLKALGKPVAKAADPLPDADDDTDPDDTDVWTGDPDVAALLLAAINEVEHAEPGEDVQPVLDALFALRDDPGELHDLLGDTFQKAFDSDKHPRGDDGRFIAKKDIAAAQNDPAKAEALKQRVTDPEQRKKLDAALGDTSGAFVPAKEHAKRQTAAKREAKQADGKTALGLVYKIRDAHASGRPVSADDLHALIPHLSKLGHDELSNVRTQLFRMGASFGGTRKLQERADKLAAWARGAALDARMDEQGFSENEKEAGKRAVGATGGQVAPEPKAPAPAPDAAEPEPDDAPLSPEEQAAGEARIQAARERYKQRVAEFERERAAQQQSPAPHPAAAPTPANIASADSAAVHDFLAGEYGNLKMVPVSAIRRHLAERMPGATKEQIDEALLDMRREKKVRLISADGDGPDPDGVRAGGVRAVGENFIYVEPAAAMPAPRAPEQRPGGGVKRTAAPPEAQERTLTDALGATRQASGMSPVHEMRAAYMRAHPDASPQDFNESLLKMRRDGKVRLISIDDRSRATRDQLRGSVFHSGETLFYAEPTDTIGAAPDQLPGGAADAVPDAAAPDEYPELRRNEVYDRLRMPDADSPAVARVPDADVRALAGAVASNQWGDSGLAPFAALRKRLGWSQSKFAHVLTAAAVRGVARLSSSEGGGGAAWASNEELATDASTHDRYAYAQLTPAGREDATNRIAPPSRTKPTAPPEDDGGLTLDLDGEDLPGSSSPVGSAEEQRFPFGGELEEQGVKSPAAPAPVDVAGVYGRSGRDAKHSEMNAAMRAAAGMARAAAAAELRKIGYEPAGDPRAQLSQMIYDRYNARARQFLIDRPESRSPEKQAEYDAHQARNDEPLLKPADVLSGAPKSAPAQKPKPKPARAKTPKTPTKAPALDSLKRKPLADKEHIGTLAARATGAAKDYLETAAHNLTPGDRAPADSRHLTVERLAAAHRDALTDGDPGAAQQMARAVEQFGGRFAAKPGDTVKFDALYYDHLEGLPFDAQVRVVRPPVLGPDGRVAVKGAVEPVGQNPAPAAAKAPRQGKPDIGAVHERLRAIGQEAATNTTESPEVTKQRVRDQLAGLSLADLRQLHSAMGYRAPLKASSTAEAVERVTANALAAAGGVLRADA